MFKTLIQAEKFLKNYQQPRLKASISLQVTVCDVHLNYDVYVSSGEMSARDNG